jgi:tRNA(fMet)-specific endonuclease VapC
MIYLLDTDIFVLLSRGIHVQSPRNERERNAQRAARLIATRCEEAQARQQRIGLSAISLAELEYGLNHGGNFEKRHPAYLKILAPFEAFAFDAGDCVRHYGLVRERLEAKGRPIGPLDMLIAAHALALGATLVTNNTREFKRVKDLHVENWSS